MDRVPRRRHKPNRVALVHEGWGRNLRRWRKRRGWTQAQLAELAGVSQAQISETEHGTAPSDAVKMRLCEALQVDMVDVWAWPQFIPPERAA